jgi:uncharacterized protein YecA (UPF0149 family)
MTERRFPDAEERARIIARRNQLHRDLIEYLVTHSPDDQQAREQFNSLAREYGFDEVYRMLQKISPLLNRPKDPDAEDVYLYKQYVEIYRRFGGDRPFLSLPEYHHLNHERAMLLARPMLQEQQLSVDEQRRLDELSDTLLSESYLWDDLVPERPPKVLAKEQGAPPIRKVGRNESCPCGSGRKYKHCHGR